MKPIRLSSLAVVALVAAACSDPTTPTRALLSGPSMVHATETFVFPSPGFPSVTDVGQVGPGNIVLCKTANEGGTFDFTATVNSGTGTLFDATPSITIPSGGGTGCVLVYDSPALIPLSTIDQVTITEAADISAEWDLTAVHVRQLLVQGIFDAGDYTAAHLADVEDLGNRRAVALVNDDMARVVTFTNTFTAQPTTGCTYTKGWYQNKNGAPTVISVDGRSIAEAQAILAAKPGQLGGVTLSGTSNTNLLLNVYQQLLAALNNLGGDANIGDAPADVQTAINTALGGTGGTGLAITTTLTQQQLGSLAATLAAFNEGTFEGWPHCEA